MKFYKYLGYDPAKGGPVEGEPGRAIAGIPAADLEVDDDDPIAAVLEASPIYRKGTQAEARAFRKAQQEAATAAAEPADEEPAAATEG